MGIDRKKCVYPYNIRPEFICSVCLDVLEDPVVIGKCDHLFCRLCLTKWMENKSSCPMHNSEITVNDIRPAPHYFKSLMGEIKVMCGFGCEKRVSIFEVGNHMAECKHNPDKVWKCETCNEQLNGSEIKMHDCVDVLQKQLEKKSFEVQVLGEKLKICEISLENVIAENNDLMSLKFENECMAVKVSKCEALAENVKLFMSISDSANRALGDVARVLREMEKCPLTPVPNENKLSKPKWDSFIIKK